MFVDALAIGQQARWLVVVGVLPKAFVVKEKE